MQRALSPVLIGRERELGELEDILLASSRGDARVAMIAGDAGMGKTRLSEELIVRARKIGYEVLTGACSEAELSLPYLPFVEAVGNYLSRADLDVLRKRLGASAAELGRLFPRLAGPAALIDSGDPAHARLRLCEALAELLHVPAEKRGLLLVLEDLHWADASTREVLDFLVRRLRTGRVMILGTYRSDEMHRKHPLLPTVQGWMRSGLVDVVDLVPLTPNGVGAMVCAIFDAKEISNEFRDYLLNRCEGNPFVLEEMLKLAIERGDIYRSEKGWERKDIPALRLPRTVKDTILLRVERLDEAQIQLLSIAAVLGRSFETSLLATASGQPPEVVEETLHAAEQQQILEEELGTTRYRFRHALTREVIYEDLPAPRRERLHLHAAAVLRGRPGVAAVEVVRHLMAGNAFAEALPLARQAADDASRIGAYQEATELFRRLLPRITDTRERADVLCELGRACSFAGEIADAVEYLTEGIAGYEQLGETITAARYRIDLGRAHALRGSMVAEREELERVVRTLEPAGPGEALARAYMRLAALHNFNFEFTEGLAFSEKAEQVAIAAGADEVRIWNYNFKGVALAGLGQVDEGYNWLLRSYRDALERDLRWIAGNALNNINAFLLWTGEVRAREAIANVALMRELRVGMWSVTSPPLTEATVALLLGELMAGVERAAKAIELGTTLGNLWVVRYGEIYLGALYIELGRLDDARPLLGITHEERQRDSQEALMIIRHGLAAGDVERALEAARFLLERDEAGLGVARSADAAVEALVAGGAHVEARRMVEGFARQPWIADSPYVLRSSARVALAEGDVSAASRDAARAYEVFRDAGYRLDEARTLLLLGRTAAAAGDPERAREHVRAAAAIASEVGGVTVLKEAQREMERHGGHLERPVEPAISREEAAPAGERLVTVLFADVRGYSALTQTIAPADLADRISALQRWAVAEVERHHGVVDKFAGDALMATFNISGASVDHAVHALQAGLALRDKAAMLGLPLGLGVATGAAVVGHMARGANLSVLGETTNLASRLQGQAGPGEVLLSDESYRRVEEWLEHRGLPSEPVRLSLKGLDGETAAVRLSGPVEVAIA